MDESTVEFLASSPVAERIKLPARVVLHRTVLTPREIARIKSGERTLSPDSEEAVCELEVGGRIVATGRIVKKRGKYQFRVREVM